MNVCPVHATTMEHALITTVPILVTVQRVGRTKTVKLVNELIDAT